MPEVVASSAPGISTGDPGPEASTDSLDINFPTALAEGLLPPWGWRVQPICPGSYSFTSALSSSHDNGAPVCEPTFNSPIHGELMSALAIRGQGGIDKLRLSAFIIG